MITEWVCDKCGVIVAPFHVTNDETHEDCGGECRVITAGTEQDPIVQHAAMRGQLIVSEAECARLKAEVARLRNDHNEAIEVIHDLAIKKEAAERERDEARERINIADKVLADWCDTDELDACDAVLAARAALAGEEG